MNKSKKKIYRIIVLIIAAIVCLLLLNSKYEFLPQQVTDTVNELYSRIFNKSEAETVDTSDFVFLSTLTDSPLFDKMDLLVPSTIYIPTKDEVDEVYSGLYADANTIIASLEDTDIIVQGYGIDLSDEMDLIDFREQVVAQLSLSRPDIEFDASRIVQNGKVEIPIIEFSTEYEEGTVYSMIAFISIKGEFITLAVNSEAELSDVHLFFDTLLKNIMIVA